MKKVRVLKELPFAKVGKIVQVKEDSYMGWKNLNEIYDTIGANLKILIRDGWLEWVEEEESLEEKFKGVLKTFITNILWHHDKSIASLCSSPTITNILWHHDKEGWDENVEIVFSSRFPQLVEALAPIAKEYYLAVFDKAVEKHSTSGLNSIKNTIYANFHIRKALEDA